MFSRISFSRIALFGKPFNALIKKPKRNYKTTPYPFGGGCIIKAEENGRSNSENKSDLLASIPINLYNRSCVTVVVDPTAMIRDKDNIAYVLTEVTHIAAFISTPSLDDELSYNADTLMSKVPYGLPKDPQDAHTLEFGIIKGQEFILPARFHDKTMYYDRIFKIPEGAYHQRFYIFICIDTFTENVTEFVDKIKTKTQDYQINNVIYHRQKDSCAHAVLFNYADIDNKKYPSLVPQRSAITLVHTLFIKNKPIVNEFKNISKASGLSNHPFRCGIIYQERNNPDSNTIKPTSGRKVS
jgi:hypothetical protein